MTAVEFLLEKYKSQNTLLFADDFEQAIAMDKKALEIIRKLVNEFDEEGEVSWNTRDEAQNFLTTFKSE